MIEKHNADNFTFSMNHNAYSHLTWSEFKTHMNLGFNMPPRRKVYHQHVAVDTATLPTEVDWAAEGAVTNVKDQGSCGSCWSFSSTGALEGAYKIKLGSLKSFSEQMLVDCDQYDYGCNGGLMDNAFKWVGENGGLCLEDDYAYTSGTTKKEGECASSSCTAVSGSTVTSWADVDTNEDALTSAVAQQPVAVAIEADQLPFQFYSGGVFTGRCGTSTNVRWWKVA
jgi:C1A family cysteine protease